MVQLKPLWDFMQVDLAADAFEAEMRKSPNRLKYAKNRNILMEQQANMKKIEEDIVVMQDRLEAVRDEAVRLEGVLSGAIEDINANPPTDADEAAKRSESVRKLVDTLTRYEQELQKLSKDATARDRQQKEIRARAVKAKQVYDEIKQIYDKEFKADSEKLKAMRAKTDAEASKIDSGLIEKYRGIKAHSTPPMAKLLNGQCCGCFMSLPSATLRLINEGGKVIECDNCGRIIYIDEAE